MTPRVTDGIPYDAQLVSDLRRELIAHRNTALDLGNFHIAVTYSHIIAVLSHYIELLQQHDDN